MWLNFSTKDSGQSHGFQSVSSEPPASNHSVRARTAAFAKFRTTLSPHPFAVLPMFFLKFFCER